MKTHLLVLLALALGMSREPFAQSECNPRFRGCPVGGTYKCNWRTNWNDAVDLDGDGVPDFRLMSAQGELDCFSQPGGLPPHAVDEFNLVEAYFPEPSAHMYIQLHRGFSGPGSPLLTNQQPVEPQPSPGVGFTLYWAWNPPEALVNTLQNGFGLLDIGTYDSYGNDGIGSRINYYEGLLRQTNSATIGFRLSKPDGWHLGWMTIELLATPVTRPDGQQAHIRLADYAVHPNPDTVIYAGEKPRPKLDVTLAADKITISWLPTFTGWTLEGSQSLSAVAWQPISGVVSNTVSLDPGNSLLFLRLRQL